jgi:hypothetical protein
MSCGLSHRLPWLAAGGDLFGPDLERWRGHAAGCAECRDREHSGRDTIAQLRSAAPPVFEEVERAGIRRAVWRAIEAERAPLTNSPRVFVRRPVLAAATAALALAVLGLWIARRGGEAIPMHVAGPTPASVPAIAATDADALSDVALPRRPKIEGARLAHRRRHPAARLEPGAPSRLEIATPDPDVRIIWLYEPADADADTPSDAAALQEVP